MGPASLCSDVCVTGAAPGSTPHHTQTRTWQSLQMSSASLASSPGLPGTADSLQEMSCCSPLLGSAAKALRFALSSRAHGWWLRMWPLSELVCIPQKGTCPHAERCRAMAWLHGSGGGGTGGQASPAAAPLSAVAYGTGTCSGLCYRARAGSRFTSFCMSQAVIRLHLFLHHGLLQRGLLPRNIIGAMNETALDKASPGKGAGAMRGTG